MTLVVGMFVVLSLQTIKAIREDSPWWAFGTGCGAGLLALLFLVLIRRLAQIRRHALRVGASWHWYDWIPATWIPLWTGSLQSPPGAPQDVPRKHR